jgi:Uma2 family endonuclease
MTDDEIAAFYRQNSILQIERSSAGYFLISAGVDSATSRRNARAGGLLFVWYTQHPRLGEVFDSNGGFTLPDGSMRSPDAAWVSMAKWQALTDDERKNRFAPLCPEFVIELKSGSDSLRDLQRKMTDTWLANGTQLAFLIDAESETSWIYRAGQAVPDVFAGFDRELSGEPVLPGFSFDLRMLR